MPGTRARAVASPRAPSGRRYVTIPTSRGEWRLGEGKAHTFAHYNQRLGPASNGYHRVCAPVTQVVTGAPDACKTTPGAGRFAESGSGSRSATFFVAAPRVRL